jgi:hypothetical protein
MLVITSARELRTEEELGMEGDGRRGGREKYAS